MVSLDFEAINLGRGRFYEIRREVDEVSDFFDEENK
jgi:hypothetical protein